MNEIGSVFIKENNNNWMLKRTSRNTSLPKSQNSIETSSVWKLFWLLKIANIINFERQVAQCTLHTKVLVLATISSSVHLKWQKMQVSFVYICIKQEKGAVISKGTVFLKKWNVFDAIHPTGCKVPNPVTPCTRLCHTIVPDFITACTRLCHN